MTKYTELAKQYSAEIAEIKKLKAHYAELVDQANMAEDDDAAETLYQEAEIVHDDLVEKSVELQTDIEAAYSSAPFAKTREAGIAGFYKAAGLS